MSRCAHGVHVDAHCGDCLAATTDEQLRAEFERRGMRFDEECRKQCSYVAVVDRVKAERDQLKLRAEAAEESALRLRDERDNWKAVALNGGNACGTNTFKFVQKERDMLLTLRDELKRRAEVAEARSAWGINSMCRGESGPGIAATPARTDNAHYFDPIDLLADDA